MNPKQPKHGLMCFDWDGTLVNSTSTIVHCATQAFSDIGRTVSPQTIAKLIGQSEAFITELHFQDDLEAAKFFWKQFRTYYAASPPTALIMGAQEILHTLHEDFSIAIITNKSKNFLEKELKFNKIESVIDYTYTADLWPAKPDPAMIEAAMLESTHSIENTWMVGDSTADHGAAMHAGVHFIPMHADWHPQSLTLEDLIPYIHARTS